MTTLDTARDILVGRWFVSTDKPAYRAEVTEAAQCAIDGDDTDLCIHIAEANAWERYGGQFDGDDTDLCIHIAEANAWERYGGQFDGDFAQWYECNPWAGNPIAATPVRELVA